MLFYSIYFYLSLRDNSIQILDKSLLEWSKSGQNFRKMNVTYSGFVRILLSCKMLTIAFSFEHWNSRSSITWKVPSACEYKTSKVRPKFTISIRKNGPGLDVMTEIVICWSLNHDPSIVVIEELGRNLKGSIKSSAQHTARNRRMTNS